MQLIFYVQIAFTFYFYFTYAFVPAIFESSKKQLRHAQPRLKIPFINRDELEKFLRRLPELSARFIRQKKST